REGGMTKQSVSTRRSFLRGGALVAAPLAVAAAPPLAADERDARLVRLEDESAIRDLHQTWLRRTNAGEHAQARQLFADPRALAFDDTVRRLAADHGGEPDRIQLASDGVSAIGRFACAVERESAIPQDCTLAQMAHAQGGGRVRTSERGVLNASYVKRSG